MSGQPLRKQTRANAERRASAIGEAATRAVVYSLIIVLGADTFVNAIFYFIPGLI